MRREVKKTLYLRSPDDAARATRASFTPPLNRPVQARAMIIRIYEGTNQVRCVVIAQPAAVPGPIGLMPVGGVAGQPGAFQAEHDPGPAQRHLGDQVLESFPVRGAGAGLALVDVDHGDLVSGPAQRDRLAAQVARRKQDEALEAVGDWEFYTRVGSEPTQAHSPQDEINEELATLVTTEIGTRRQLPDMPR
jgi:hypothetical protein